SNFVSETTRELLSLGDRHIEVLPNPVDVKKFKPITEKAEQPGLIVFVGTVCEKKGVRQLVEAMPQIVAAKPEAELWIVGRDSVDPESGHSYSNQLRLTIPVRLQKQILFKGPIEHTELPSLLSQASVCVYPSHMEALPIAWIEGMAMGKAIAASKTGPGSEVISHGESGLLCDPHNPGSIAQEIIRLLDDKELRQRLGKGARQRAEQNFSLDVLIARNEAFYERCLSGRMHGA
ncbi:MAG TPA: glycosyltransferase family 4 protein, partial [Blastocatellia bacterium]|nr:glycosyltransferase family 4 protein [Blastocatellia bacterium]